MRDEDLWVRQFRPRRWPWVIAAGATLGALVLAAVVFEPARASQPVVEPLNGEEQGTPGHRPVASEPLEIRELRRLIKKLAPLQRRLAPPGPGDWLAEHSETGQTFEQYLAGNPTSANQQRRYIDIQPIGRFKGIHKRALRLTAELMRIYFQLEVRLHSSIPLRELPERAWHKGRSGRQLHTFYLLEELLKPRIPGDSAAMLGLTTSDLWPGPGWNFVFGQASLDDRVGIWSVDRNGDPQLQWHQFLRRTVATATHETGHMFSIQHETRFACNMCGANSQRESDRHPLWLCHESLAKLCYATGADPVERYKQLVAWCDTNGFDEEARFYRRALRALTSDSQ